MSSVKEGEFRIHLIKDFLEIASLDTDGFLKVKETLSRIGIANHKTKTLWQSAHIFHKQGRYFITHFKELFALDGRETDITDEDLARRTHIAEALQSWGMVKILRANQAYDADMGGFTVIKYSDKHEWKLIPKYVVGGPKVKKNA